MSASNLPDPDVEVKASSDAADVFVSNYYQAINSKTNLDGFYVNSNAKYLANADISVNGAVLSTPAEYLKLLESQGPGVTYDVESFDAQVMNPSYKLNAPPAVLENPRAEKNGSRMSIVVTTMGRVQFGRGKDSMQKMFNETFVLVPNWDGMVKNPPRGLKRWLIMSQNFRAL